MRGRVLPSPRSEAAVRVRDSRGRAGAAIRGRGAPSPRSEDIRPIAVIRGRDARGHDAVRSEHPHASRPKRSPRGPRDSSSTGPLNEASTSFGGSANKSWQRFQPPASGWKRYAWSSRALTTSWRRASPARSGSSLSRVDAVRTIKLRVDRSWSLSPKHGKQPWTARCRAQPISMSFDGDIALDNVLRRDSFFSGRGSNPPVRLPRRVVAMNAGTRCPCNVEAECTRRCGFRSIFSLCKAPTYSTT
mmetsp:Transcript_30350/g.91217  ORF Transcript_30350/g.91217 Transcript_30350/m.91217 type:complete len:246 (+) Transcript_30350:977-1714(+)